MLIFDEADSFLQNRNNAQRSFEVTQVNEMLTWMESHEYPFVWLFATIRLKQSYINKQKEELGEVKTMNRKEISNVKSLHPWRKTNSLFSKRGNFNFAKKRKFLFCSYILLFLDLQTFLKVLY